MAFRKILDNEQNRFKTTFEIMKLAIEIIERELSQRKMVNNQYPKNLNFKGIQEEIESLENVLIELGVYIRRGKDFIKL